MRKMMVCILVFFMSMGIFMGPYMAHANMFRGDLQKTGIYESTVPENNSLLWSYEIGDIMESSPVIYEDMLYVGAEDGKVYCLDAQTGEWIWDFQTQNEVDSTPTVVDDVVYFGSADMKLYALNASSGEEIWNYSFAASFGQIVSSPIIYQNMVIIGSKDGNLYAINITSHLLEWTFPTEDEIWGSAAAFQSYVYIGSLDGRLYCLWGENGTEKWNFSSNLTEPMHGIYATPMISSGRLYIGSEDHNLYSLDAVSGDLIWSFLSPRYVYASASVHEGRVFIHTLGSPNGFMFALPENDPNDDGIISDTEVLWVIETEDWDGGSSPAIADGKVVVGSRNRLLYCLNETTGAEIWNLTTGEGIVASPAIVNGIVYISSRDGYVYAIGGLGPSNLDIEIIVEHSSIKAGRVMGISFLVTHNGDPVEGAFVNVEVSEGELSQSGASTFPDGSQRIKYTSPLASGNLTVTAHATATKFGYEDGESEVQFTVVPASSYSDVGSGDTFSLESYWPYLVLIVGLIAVNMVIIILRVKKGKSESGNNESE
jgi:outer membrane protein assembly factor BamB